MVLEILVVWRDVPLLAAGDKGGGAAGVETHCGYHVMTPEYPGQLMVGCANAITGPTVDGYHNNIALACDSHSDLRAAKIKAVKARSLYPDGAQLVPAFDFHVDGCLAVLDQQWAGLNSTIDGFPLLAEVELKRQALTLATPTRVVFVKGRGRHGERNADR